MSVVFRVRCETCEEDGPKLRRSSSVTLCTESVTGPFDEDYHASAKLAWHMFLLRHEFHALSLRTEP